MQSAGTAQMLGGLSARQFLARHWQKRPLLVRGALPEFAGMLSPAALRRLAGREDARARLFLRRGRHWQVEHGPFARASFKGLGARAWTLLVQDVDHFVPRARQLLQRFDFVPYARLDDLMVSYAPPGGGVGPHCDSYDVFLLQGSGRRRWRIGAQQDRTLVADAPLKLLARFRPDEEHVLEPGDLLYLPPGYAHDGIAVDACTTYSIGFRAPAWQELAVEFLAFLQDQVALDGIYADPGLAPTSHPAQIGRDMLRQVEARLAQVRWGRADVLRFLGAYLTEPKPHVFFTRPQGAAARAVFHRRAKRFGVELDLKTQMLYAGNRVFFNGECIEAPRGVSRLRQLADRRHLRLAADDEPALVDRLYAWYRAGELRLAGTAKE
jgi:50S ribosomal protein L16 3-hydroxylase